MMFANFAQSAYLFKSVVSEHFYNQIDQQF